MAKSKTVKSIAPKSATRRTVAKDKGPALDDDGFEILGGGTSQEMQVGEVVTGTYGGVVRTMPAAKKGQAPVPFYSVGDRLLLGGAVLRTRIEEGKVAIGDTLRVTRLDDAPAKKGRNPAKIYDVRVKRLVPLE